MNSFPGLTLIQHSYPALRSQIPWVLVMWSLPRAASASHYRTIATTASLGNSPPPPLNGSPGNSVHLLLLFPVWRRRDAMDGDVMEYFPCCFSKISKISWSALHTTPQPSSWYLSRLDARGLFLSGLITINAREYIGGESEYLVITSWSGNGLIYVMRWTSLTHYWTLTSVLSWCKQIISVT